MKKILLVMLFASLIGLAVSPVSAGSYTINSNIPEGVYINGTVTGQFDTSQFSTFNFTSAKAVYTFIDNTPDVVYSRAYQFDWSPDGWYIYHVYYDYYYDPYLSATVTIGGENANGGTPNYHNSGPVQYSVVFIGDVDCGLFCTKHYYNLYKYVDYGYNGDFIVTKTLTASDLASLSSGSLNFTLSTTGRLQLASAQLIFDATDVVSPTLPDASVSFIVFASDRTGNDQIYKINEDRTNEIRLTNNTATDSGPAISPDGKSIAFISNRNGSWALYKMAIDGTNVVQLATLLGNAGGGIDWHPSGTKLIFSAPNAANNTWILYQINSDGSGQVPLTDETRDAAGAHYSKDGAKIYFHRNNQYNADSAEIYVMNSDGTGLAKLTATSGSHAGANFYPDQIFINGVPKIVFARGIGAGEHIFNMNPDGTSAIDIFNIDTSYWEWGPISERDNQVVFSSNRPGTGTGLNHIWKMNADGTNPIQITSAEGHSPSWWVPQVKIAFIKSNDIYITDEQGNTPVNITNTPSIIKLIPRFSPDGSKVAFYSNSSGRYEIWVINIDGSNLQQITNYHTTYQAYNDGGPVWSPDGQWIFFGSAAPGDGEAWKIKVDGTGLTQLTNVPGYNTQSFDISRDGVKACFDLGVQGNGYTNQLYMSAADFTNQVLVQASYAPHRSKLSPDGTKIVYQAATGGQLGTHIINTDGTNDVFVTGAIHAGWHPDGTKLLITQGGNIYWINADGSNQTLVTTGADWQATAAYSVPSIGVTYTVPGAPTEVTAMADNGRVVVSFTTPSDGGSSITAYTVTASPGGLTTTGTSSPITLEGLTVGVAYTFTVTATNSVGTSAASSPSNSVTLSSANYTIIASAGIGGTILPSGDLTVNAGGNAAFTITPASGYRVESVLVDGVSVGAVTTYNFTNVQANHTIAVSCTLDVYIITATASGGGSISPSGATTVVGGGSQTYAIVPDAGYKIAYVAVNGGSVNLAADNSYTVTNVRQNYTIKADFVPITYTITASAGAEGGIAPSGTGTFSTGVNQTYSITPNAGYHVADVQVNGQSVGAVTSYPFTTITANHTITATFAPNPSYTITASAGANGSVSPAGTTTLLGGLSRTITITPNSGYVVSSVIVDGVNVGVVASYSFNTVNSNHTISVSFVNTYNITASTMSANGTISPAGPTAVPAGGSQTYSITPNAGYKINYVAVNGASVGAVSSYTFTNVRQNYTIRADFVPITYKITVTQGAHGTISPGTYNGFKSGASQTYTITADSGYNVADVLVDGSSVGAQSSYAFSNINANHTISAIFMLKP